MCMTFGCNPPIIFVIFSQFELSHFGSTSIKHSDTEYFVNAAPPKTLTGCF